MSGVAPKALASRMAISVDTPACPLISRESVVRLTPNAFAASVTDRPNGSRQLSRTDWPGCGGIFMVIGVFSFKFSGNRSDRPRRRSHPQGQVGPNPAGIAFFKEPSQAQMPKTDYHTPL